MQLERFLPEYEMRELHAVNIDASPEQVYQAIKNLTAEQISPLISLMFNLRSLPARLTGKEVNGIFKSGSILDQMYRMGFIALAEDLNHEIVFGLIGRFWESALSLSPVLVNPEGFLAFNAPSYAKAAMNYLVTARDGGVGSRCSTETRVNVPDPKTRRAFTFYWRIISMGS